MKISAFQMKDVINIVDGKKIGMVSDLELDLREGRIEAIVVPHYKKFGWLGSGTEIVIPWRNIVKIGADVVLVLIEESRTYRTSDDNEHLR
ncbi:YlmC/YmxH family sporulation protein [Paenibacillus sp. SYP-B4298]|uniref:YlmC/YmxH family sporulation protein n=1 Tax=Paenibacillus sp. SYP-B4298 TaxID=2996034 RepID=UPI0022DD0FAB|nr:YlmC/YmxH family sporulation protein [Paenibacillus sp. SYP-B4298]